MLGFARRPPQHAGRNGAGAGAGPRNELRPRVLGMSAERWGTLDLAWFRALAHPLRSSRGWYRRRRLGPYTDDAWDPEVGRRG